VTEKKLGSSKTLHHRETPDFIAVNKRLAHIVRQRRQELKWTIEQGGSIPVKAHRSGVLEPYAGVARDPRQRAGNQAVSTTG
jgi:hypothetical protein